MRIAALGIVLAACCVNGAVGREPEESPDRAIQRAVAFLAREVPSWPKENRCFSCHNNGDAFRALHLAAVDRNQRTANAQTPGNPSGGRAHESPAGAVPAESLAETIAWLRNPQGWKDNGGEVEFSDRRLAAVQFAAALAQVERTRRAAGIAPQAADQPPQMPGFKSPLRLAAQQVAEQQGDDGAWAIDAAGSVGSPVTYGTPLATVVARAVLQQADATRFGPSIAKADHWLAQFRPQRVLDAAALLLWLVDVKPEAGANSALGREAKIAECVEIIRRGQGENGGWGPFVTSAAEPFDTAVVLLALHKLGPDEYSAGVVRTAGSKAAAQDGTNGTDGWAAMIERGRHYLAASQYDDGSWPETTRPVGGESYAQRMSTTGWATMALLETQPRAGQP